MVKKEVNINGKPGTAVFLTVDFKPTTPDKAEMVKVLFDDGTHTFFLVPSRHGLTK